MPKNLFVFSAILLLLLACGPGSPAAGHDMPNVIKFGIFPYKSPRTIVRLFGPIVKRLEKSLDMKVQLVTAPDFQSYVDRGRQGEYDLAFPCVTCFFQIQDAGYTVIARGEPSFHGGTLVRKDSGLTTVAQLRGKKVAAIGKHSYAGYLFLVEQLHDQGIDPQEEVEFHFLGKLDSIVYGVLNGTYEAGTIRSDALKSPVFEGVDKDLTFISISPAIPQFPFVVKKDMPAGQVAKIRQVLTALSLEDDDDRQILQSLRVKTISPASDADYGEFRRSLTRVQELSR